MRRRGVALALLLLPLVACSSATGDGAGDKPECSDLAAEAVRISEDQALSPRLLKVREPVIVEDNRDTYELPTGSGEALVLTCRGTGVWSPSELLDVTLKLTVDSDGEGFVEYRPVG